MKCLSPGTNGDSVVVSAAMNRSVFRSFAVSVYTAFFPLGFAVFIFVVGLQSTIPIPLRVLYCALIAAGDLPLVWRAFNVRLVIDTDRILVANLFRTLDVPWAQVEEIGRGVIWVFPTYLPPTGIGIRRVGSQHMVAARVTLTRKIRTRALTALGAEAAKHGVPVSITAETLDKDNDGLIGLWLRRRRARGA